MRALIKRQAMSNKNPVLKFNPDAYARIALSDLVVYSVHYLHKQGCEIAREDVVSACFTLFPKKFSLRKYPHWPDSAVVGRRWSDCRRKGYIVGSAARGFKLTLKGFKHAEKIGKALGISPRPAHAIPAEMRTRAGRFVRSMETSDAFIHYKKSGSAAKVNEFDVRSMLLCTMESSPATMQRNMEQFKEYAGEYGRHDLLAFLNACGRKFPHLLDARRHSVKAKPRK